MLRDETVGSRSARHTAASATVSNKVLVAVKAEKVISNTALAWALTHVVHSSDSITLLAVYSAQKTGTYFSLNLSINLNLNRIELQSQNWRVNTRNKTSMFFFFFHMLMVLYFE